MLEISSIFFWQLEKSREAVDLANIRATYAEVMTASLAESADGTNGVTKGTDGSYSKDVTLIQSEKGWTGDNASVKIGGVTVPALDSVTANTTKIEVKLAKNASVPTLTVK